MTEKKFLGEFRVGRYVHMSTYGGFGSVSHYYGRVLQVDVKRSKVIWTVLGREPEEKPTETEYPPPRFDEPSSWKFSVVLKKEVPKQSLLKERRMARKKKSLGRFRAGRYVCSSSYPCMAAVDLEKTYGRVVRVDIENSKIIYLLPDLGGMFEFHAKYPQPTKVGGYDHSILEVVRKKDIPRSELKKLERRN